MTLRTPLASPIDSYSALDSSPDLVRLRPGTDGDQEDHTVEQDLGPGQRRGRLLCDPQGPLVVAAREAAHASKPSPVHEEAQRPSLHRGWRGPLRQVGGPHAMEEERHRVGLGEGGEQEVVGGFGLLRPASPPSARSTAGWAALDGRSGSTPAQAVRLSCRHASLGTEIPNSSEASSASARARATSP